MDNEQFIFREKTIPRQGGIPPRLVPMGLQLSSNINGEGNSSTLLPNSGMDPYAYFFINLAYI